MKISSHVHVAPKRPGVESVWVPEAWGRDAFLALAAIAEVTDHVKLGTGIVNVYSRSPAALSMAAATLDELSGGRSILGLGSSGAGVVERWHGIRYGRPVARVRETVEIVRMALSGATTDFQGSLFQVGGFKLALDRPKRKIPIYIAALGPKMLRLAGKIADGVLLYLWSLPTIPTAISEVRKGAEEVGRSLDNFEVATVLPVAVSENRREAQAIIARAIAYYVGGMGTYYRRVISQSAFASEASKITEEWQRGDRVSATKAVTERLIDSVAVAGSVTHCGRKLEQFASKGMTLPILSPSIEGANAAMRFCQTIKSLVAN